MRTALESYATLHYSPFVLAPLFEAFYKTLTPQARNILLGYLVLPLSLYPNCRAFLKNARSTSSLTTFCREPQRLYGLPERIREYQEVTHTCLQLAVDAGAVRIEDDLSVIFLRSKLDVSVCPVDAIRAAGKLGMLLQPFDIPAVYRLLGVKRL